MSTNWWIENRTTLMGILTVVNMIAAIIAAAPEYLNFLPVEIRGYVLGICSLIATISGSLLAWFVKDKDMTGIPGVNCKTKEDLVRNK